MPAVFGEVVVRVGDHRATGARGGIVVPGPQEYPVRVGAGLHRAVIGVADREGVGQRELERQVAALEVAHRVILLGLRPLPHAAVVPGALRIGPGVRGAFHAHVAEVRGGIQRERRDRALAAGVGLQPQAAGAATGLQCSGRRNEAIAEATHARQGAEVVIERAGFLHHHHDVLQVFEAARLRGRGNRCGPGDAWQQRGKAGGNAGLQQPASADIGHGLTHRSTRKEMPTVRGAPMKALSRPSTPARYRLSVRLLTTRLAPMPFRRGDRPCRSKPMLALNTVADGSLLTLAASR
ncbi:hypothetical protein G6F57_012689 [Rhizopus arrhizus]|nr:hypothetical protein G6F57_012689 [Rhizopus arrhizus]